MGELEPIMGMASLPLRESKVVRNFRIELEPLSDKEKRNVSSMWCRRSKDHCNNTRLDD